MGNGRNRSGFVKLAGWILVMLLLSGCSLLPEEEETLAPPLVQPKREEYQLCKAVRKDIARMVKGVATFVPSDEISLFFSESGGRIQSVDIKEGQQVKKGEVLIRLESVGMESNLKLQRLSVKKLELKLASLKSRYREDSRAASGGAVSKRQLEDLKTEIGSMEIDLEAAQIVLSDLEKEYTRTVLTAPADGQITFLEDIKQGDAVEAYRTLVVLANPGKLQLYYQSQEIRGVKTGMKAEILYGGQKYSGMVILSPDNVPASAGDKYKNAILIRADKLPPGVRMGDIADISVTVEAKSGVLVIPKNALHRAFGSTTVMVLEGDAKRELNVASGIETATEVEITEGLEEGAMVILN